MLSITITLALTGTEKEVKEKDYAMHPHDQSQVASIYRIPLYPELIPNLKLGKKDREYAKNLPASVRNRLVQHVAAPRFGKSELIYARKIGDFILVFYDQPNTDDGGFELVYSLKEKRVLGWFFGDYRG